jgi:hypothetical protein
MKTLTETEKKESRRHALDADRSSSRRRSKPNHSDRERRGIERTTARYRERSGIAGMNGELEPTEKAGSTRAAIALPFFSLRLPLSPESRLPNRIGWKLRRIAGRKREDWDSATRPPVARAENELGFCWGALCCLLCLCLRLCVPLPGWMLGF